LVTRALYKQQEIVSKDFLPRITRLFVHRKGAGRRMSRSQAAKQWQGRDVVKRLELRNILIRSASARSVAEEAPGAYKDVSDVVEVTERSRLARKVAKLAPLICIKG